MREVPHLVEDRLNLQPFLWECGALHHLISIGPDGSVTDLRHKLIDGQTGQPEGILQGDVTVTIGEMSKGYCQLDSWTHGISHQGPVPLELSSDSQFSIEFRRHPDEVCICHRVII